MLAALAAALVALLVAAPSALADTFTPESGGSPNADDIDTLYKITLLRAIVIFLVVEGTLIYVLFKFRHRRSGPEGAQIRGNTPLEVGWTLAAALILVVLTVVTFVYLDDIKNPPRVGPQRAAAASRASIRLDRPARAAARRATYLRIEVNGQQYLWRYLYPGGAFSATTTMVVPVDTPSCSRSPLPT